MPTARPRPDTNGGAATRHRDGDRWWTPDGARAGWERLHADAVDTLRAWPATGRQAQLRAAYLDALDSEPMAVSKQGPPSHLTASCLVLDPDGTHVLLTLHTRARRWFQFGGHLEAGDPGLRAAAGREAREESGIDDLEVSEHLVDLDRHTLIGNFGRCREHFDVRYAAVAPRDSRIAASAESLDVAWWPVNALPEPEPGLTRLVQQARRALMG